MDFHFRSTKRTSDFHVITFVIDWSDFRKTTFTVRFFFSSTRPTW